MGWWSQAIYSKDQQNRLEELKKIYTQSLTINPEEPVNAPTDWGLSDNKPTHYMIKGSQAYIKRVEDLQARKKPNGKFHHQVTTMIEIISNYITERRTRWFGSGSPGDLIELCFDELLQFVTLQLPVYDFNKDDLEKIKHRIEYLNKLIDGNTVFQQGTFYREHNKFKALRAIRRQLRSCEVFIARESERTGIKEQLNNCKDLIGKLLDCLFRYTYYASSSKVYNQDFSAQDYIKNRPDSSYEELKSHPHGAMLGEALALAGPHLDIPEFKNEKPVNFSHTQYFDQAFNPKEFEFNHSSFGLAPWLEGPEGLSYLADLQKTLSSGIRLAPLRTILIKAIDLICLEGEHWIYGNKPGKLCLEGLLSLINSEFKAFEKEFKALDEDQQFKRDRFEDQINDAVIQNYEKVKAVKKEFLQFSEAIRKNILTTSMALEKYTLEKLFQAEKLKANFFNSLLQHLNRFNPGYNRYNPHLKFITLEHFDHSLENDNISSINLDEPLLEQGQVKRGFIATLIKILFPTENFSKWRTGYLERHEDDYSRLKSLLEKFENAIHKKPTQGNDLRLKVKAINLQIRIMQGKAETERPQWSFSWRKRISLGWPFKQTQQYFLERIIEEFKAIQDDVEAQYKKAINNNDPAVTLSLESPLTPKACVKPRETATPWIYRNGRDTLFTLKKPSQNAIPLLERAIPSSSLEMKTSM